MIPSLLIISPYFPFPVHGGGHQALYNEIDVLRREYKIILACPFAEKKNIAHLKNLWNNVHIEVLSDSLKFKKKSFLKSLKLLLTHETSRPKNFFFLEKAFLEGLFRIFYSYDETWLKFIQKICNKYSVNIIQSEFLPELNTITFLPVKTKRIFVHHEIGFIKLQRNLSLTHFSDIYKQSLISTFRNIEVYFLNQYDQIITLSETDRQHLIDAGISKPVISSPFPMEFSFNLNLKYQFNNKLVLLGGEDNFPNIDGFYWFIREIWPLIKIKYNSLKLYVVGKWSEPTKKEFSEKNILFSGYIEDLHSYLKNSISIVPIRIGSGIRVKILESLNIGIPVISTSIGAEGISRNLIHIADTPLEFSNAVDSIISGQNAFSNELGSFQKEIQMEFSADTFLDKRRQVYKN